MKKEERLASEFARLEAEWKVPGHHYPALYDVVRLAGDQNPLPGWATLAVLKLVYERFKQTRGRKGTRSKYNLDYVHHRRWAALKKAFADHGVNYSKKTGRPKTADIAHARKEASEILKGTDWHGTPRQIQKSFDKVERARAAGGADR